MNPLNPLYVAVAWVMAHIHSALSLVMPSTSGQAWFFTIVVLVVLMRLLLVPLFVKQMHSMRKMSALNPQLTELRKKYKGDKQTLNEETMRLYRENGVNPLGGCLPLLAQMPMFFALFSVLRGIADWKPGTPTPYGLTESTVKSAQNANILGAHISDKVLFTGTMHVPLEAKIVILCAVTISVITTFLTVRQSTKRGMTPADDAGQPHGGLAEVHGLHRAVLRPVRPVLGVRAGPLLGDHQRVDPRPAVRSVQAVPADGAWYRVRDRRHGTRAPAAPAKPTAVSRLTANKSVTSGKPPTTGKPATTAKSSAAPAKPAAAAKPAASTAKPAPGKSTPKPPANQPPRKKPQDTGSAGSKPARRAAPAGQQAPANGSDTSSGGLLRRLGRGKSEPEPQAETPEVKLVRQQRVRQSRSKRSGKG